MIRALSKLSMGIICAGAMAASVAPARAEAQVRIQIGPPAWFVATNQPTYYEGHASYWYGNQWHYRDGRTWRTYREEPRMLRDRRDRHQDGRHYYGREQEREQRRDRDRR
jgi:hypothetical protein